MTNPATTSAPGRTTARGWVKALVAVTFVVMVAVNGLANALPINGRTTGEVSDSYPNLFAPAGLTFSIWGLIYLLLAAHVLYQFGLFHDRDGAEGRGALLDRVGLLFAATSLANTGWILAWHYDLIGLSTVLIATLLVLLILTTRAARGLTSTRDRLFVRLPFSVYFGWITVATIANVTTWLVSLGWDGFGIAESTWTVIILVVGALIGLATVLRDRDVAYGLVFVWAYFGIWFKHNAADGFAGAHPSVMITALACIAAFVAAGVWVLARRRRAA